MTLAQPAHPLVRERSTTSSATSPATIVVPLPDTTAELTAFASGLVDCTPDYLYDIVFVDTGAPADVRQLADSFGGDVTVASTPYRDPGAVFRVGLINSTHPFVVMLPASARLMPHWLEDVLLQLQTRATVDLSHMAPGAAQGAARRETFGIFGLHAPASLVEADAQLAPLPDVAPYVQGLTNILINPEPGGYNAPMHLCASEMLRERLAMEEERRQLLVSRDGRDICWTEADDEDEPLISVRIATYNKGQLIVDRAIQSVLAQTYDRWELIVVGDHCDEVTEKAVLSVPDPRIRFYNLPTRGRYPRDNWLRWTVAGATPMNFGVQMAAGDWIAPLDDDDEFTPDHLEVLLQAAKSRRLEMVWSKSFMESSPGDWSIFGAEPHTNNVVHGTTLFSSGLRFMKLSETCWKMNRPSDGNFWDRMATIGVRMGFVDEVTYRHYAESGAREGFVGPQKLE